ncbi:serine protease [Methanosarcina sp. MSH10X1]|uniref:S8 family serine peptidase n=1 Tax=Methanosarcina sp. MSH10X1 TaxID=2507075 RepID=UPI000FFBA738|nr:S8 family serine peptidase [Methanosarcina sp. MSH10X1]RXA19949.1 serine protease [Methanosarcina sp. MSH10X1]
MFEPGQFLTPENIEEFIPEGGATQKAAKIFQDMGFRIIHVGVFSVSGEATRDLWESTFNTEVKKVTVPADNIHPERGKRVFLSNVAGAPFEIPAEVSDLVERAYPQKPPVFFGSPLPPIVSYHCLNVPGDISMLLRAGRVNQEGITGKGVLVAMPDTGFYAHKFYEWRGYNYNRTIAEDAVDVDVDNNGHGTAEAANIFSSAPGIDFVGIKMGLNPTLGFKKAMDLSPAVISCSWGWDIRERSLPNWLKPLEAAIIYAVRKLGITVVFSAGNGHYGFPGQMPEVISAGGVYVSRKLAGDDFEFKASDYASSFTSPIYPGRRVPDVCGLVGMKPNAIYIMLPVQPGCSIDRELAAGGAHPNGDMTESEDGWAAISGTSAAAPQIAGVCALLKQVQPSLSPELIKQILIASARDVREGESSMGDTAGKGFDSATGAGLVDAYSACKLARSIMVRPRFTVPPPM